MKDTLKWWGPLVLSSVWILTAFGVLVWGGPSLVSGGAVRVMVGVLVAGGGGGLVLGALVSFRRSRRSAQAKINIWSSGRPGEMLVGVLHTGRPSADPAGLIIQLNCVERHGGGQWLLWTAEVLSPSPTAPDTWPFHFSIPTEGPPSGLSPHGTVVWQLNVRGASGSAFKVSFDIPVLRVTGPASHVLPVPPPSLRSGGGPRRVVSVLEEKDRTTLQLKSRFSFPGPNPLIIWILSVVGILFISTRVTIPPGAFRTWGILNGLAVVYFSILWFSREELILSDSGVDCRRVMGNWGWSRRFKRSALTSVRVAYSGPPPCYGVQIEREGERPLAVFDGFVDPIEAHEAARVVSRVLGPRKT